MDTKNKLTAHARQVEYGYVGYVTLHENNRYMWSQSSNLISLNKEDALYEARKVIQDILIRNNIDIPIPCNVISLPNMFTNGGRAK